jgi:hypothetical protein
LRPTISSATALVTMRSTRTSGRKLRHAGGRRLHIFGGLEIERDAAGLGLVRDGGGGDLQGHGIAEALGRGHGVFRLADDALGNREAMGFEKLLGGEFA